MFRSFFTPLCAVVVALGLALTNAACTTPLTLGGRAALLPADILLLGEQHNAPEHQVWEADTVAWLAGNGALAALVLEMAEHGRSTAALPPDAKESAVQKALYWNDATWPWAAYGPVVMAAVRAGVPVLGGNLPRKQLNATTADAALDSQVPAAVWQRQLQAVRAGHCDLLPEKMLPGMVRVQIARDISLANTAVSAVQVGKTVVVVAGGGHVQRSLGIPLHLPAHLTSKVALAQSTRALAAINKEATNGDADWVHTTPALPEEDACAALRQQWQKTVP